MIELFTSAFITLAVIIDPPGCSTGTVSENVPVPVRRHVSVTAASGARNSANSEMPPSKR